MDIVDSINSINSKVYSPENSLGSNFSQLEQFSHKIVSFFSATIDFFKNLNYPLIESIVNIVFFIFAVFFVFIICYTIIRILEIRKKEHEHMHHEVVEYAHHQAEREKRELERNGNPQGVRWKNILQYASSSSQADWKLAIIDADSMLEDLLERLGFRGENIGEKLKVVDMEKYPSLSSAWDAHTVRNKIAHEGIDFDISHEETKKVIRIYENIFSDFKYI